jgi:hypothetical protein
MPTVIMKFLLRNLLTGITTDKLLVTARWLQDSACKLEGLTVVISVVVDPKHHPTLSSLTSVR